MEPAHFHDGSTTATEYQEDFTSQALGRLFNSRKTRTSSKIRLNRMATTEHQDDDSRHALASRFEMPPALPPDPRKLST